jgi:hypothetical protein
LTVIFQRRDAESSVVSSGRFSLRRIRYARPGGRLQERAAARAEDAPEAFYLDLPGAGTQLHIAKDNSQHLMISILEFGDASQVSGAAAQIARKAMRRV